MVGRCIRLAVVACGVMAWAGAPAAIAAAQEPGSQSGATAGQPEVPHLRHADSTAATLLAEGRRRSATFRQLADAIQAADVLVFVETRPRLASAGSVVFAGSTGSTRILRVRVRTPGCTDPLVAVLGHELAHVMELAAAPEVTSEDTLAAHYERVGLRMSMTATAVRRYETTAAREVEGRIRDELRVRTLVARRH